MIDEKKLIDELSKMKKNVIKHLNTANKNREATFAFLIENQLAMLNNILKCITNQPRVDKWVLCSKRLPEEPQKFTVEKLIFDRKIKSYIVMIYGAEVATTLYYEGAGKWCDEYGEIYSVVAWQPLPDPYQERS